MLPASAESVLGNFDNLTVSFHDIKTRFYQESGEYLVDTPNEAGEPQTFTVKYTFGVVPLQQYLIELEGGHIQALNVAWDSRSAEEGGQRWYHLQSGEDITPEHPFFWTRHFQNWNSRCADCHSTNVERNYSPANNTFETTFSEANVACEACHGPAGEHLKLATTGQIGDGNTGFTRQKRSPIVWQFQEGNPIAVPIGDPSDTEINACGACHSLRLPLTSEPPGGNYHDEYALQLIREPHYFPDGQIREEVFVLGSFLQSRMYEAGVTCSNCHEPHSNELLIEGNGLCAQCHQAEVYDQPAHHGLASGGECADCHMPMRTYMGVDGRRDHSFIRPMPEFADVSERIQTGDVSAVAEGIELLASGELTLMRSASLLAQMDRTPTAETVATVERYLKSGSPLVRRGAIRAASSLPPATRWQILDEVVADPIGSVRFELGSVMADAYPALPLPEQIRLRPLIDEYREMLLVNADSPATQLSLAQLSMAEGDYLGAEQAYEQALRIEPNYVPVLLSAADYYRAMRREERAKEMLDKAITLEPDSGAVNHSFGLYLIRQRQYEDALPYLAAAVEQEDALPRFAYVLAVAQENGGDLSAAIDTLVSADQRWPMQYDILMTLVLYLEKSGNQMSIPRYIRQLQEIAPASPDVRRLAARYL